MKGVRRYRPMKASQVPIWDLGLVLSALARVIRLTDQLFVCYVHP